MNLEKPGTVGAAAVAGRQVIAEAGLLVQRRRHRTCGHVPGKSSQGPQRISWLARPRFGLMAAGTHVGTDHMKTALGFGRSVGGRRPADLSWKQTEHSLATAGHPVVWQFNYRKAEGKPTTFIPERGGRRGVDRYLRPARPPTITGTGPVVSWKSINGLSYWEEDPQTGRTQGRPG